MYRCIIIDDEPHAIEGLKQYIETIPMLKLVQSFTDPLLALKTITKEEPVDLIFLDVDMPKITGIELSREIRSKTEKLIFTTAHTKYAFEAFEVNADAYLLKPYSIGKFNITIDKLFPTAKTNEEQNTEMKKFFFVKSKVDNHKLVKIAFVDVVAIESKLNYIMIHTTSKQVITYMSLTEMAKLFNDVPGFIQLHRSFIINQNFIEFIDGNTIKMTNGLEVTVGSFYKKDFNDFLNHSLIKAGKKL